MLSKETIQQIANSFDITEIGITAANTITAIQPYCVNDDDICPPLYGIIAPFARRNYYKELRQKLTKLAKELKKLYGGEFYISVNGNKLAEKLLASNSGIGFYGKNSLIINEKYGSYIVLGCIVTSLIIENIPPVPSKCGSCELCKKACPTGAIIGDGKISPSECLQFLCQQEKISEKYISFLGHKIYGCNICQDVCPMNKKALKRGDKPVLGDVGAKIYLPGILYLSDKEWRERFKGNQLSANWLPPKAIIKNALIAVYNSGAGKEILIEYSKKGREDLKDFAKKLSERII